MRENNGSGGSLTMPVVQTLSDEEGAAPQTPLDPDLASVFKGMKTGLYVFAGYAILLIPSNSIGVKCA